MAASGTELEPISLRAYVSIFEFCYSPRSAKFLKPRIHGGGKRLAIFEDLFAAIPLLEQQPM
jgi:hypothetical protein